MMKNFEELLDPAKMKEFIWPNFIAGGCLRDAWYEKEMVDVDWFIGVYQTTFDDIGNAGDFSLYDGSLIPRATTKGVNFKNNGTSFVPGSDFISCTSKDMPGLNIIVLPWEEDHLPSTSASSKALAEKTINTFPVSISQIAYIPSSEEWVLHDEFKKTLDTGICYVNSKTETKYLRKIWPKYDDLFGGHMKSCWR
jgi:hypothetical protein